MKPETGKAPAVQPLPSFSFLQQGTFRTLRTLCMLSWRPCSQHQVGLQQLQGGKGTRPSCPHHRALLFLPPGTLDLDSSCHVTPQPSSLKGPLWLHHGGSGSLHAENSMAVLLKTLGSKYGLWQHQQSETEVCQVRKKLFFKMKKTEGREVRHHNKIRNFQESRIQRPSLRGWCTMNKKIKINPTYKSFFINLKCTQHEHSNNNGQKDEPQYGPKSQVRLCALHKLQITIYRFWSAKPL